MRQKTRQLIFLFFGFLAAVAADQWTKQLASAGLKGRAPYVIWEGVFELLYSENRGAAFGILQGKQWFFTAIGIAVLAAAVYLLYRMPEDRRYSPLRILAMFICSGAVGNMIDRVAYGYVVDFLYFKWINFPIFNVADCYVTVSTFVFVLLALFYYREEDFQWISAKKREESV